MPNSRKRPKLKIPKTKSEWFWDIIGYLFFFGSIIFLVSVWGKLPEKVPGHYDASGKVDRWGSKWELLILPGVGAILALLMQVLEKFPHIYNYPDRLNESNAKQFYVHSRKLLNQLKNICLIFFALILLESIVIAMGWDNGFGKWFLPIVIIGMGIPIASGIVTQRKIK
ncbi:DUF1648 domain-containing protein [Heyndrickxia coagulans]|uniref:DUF1648 domain-containing protein n=1 Tax=Heyndrickxia coagulans TaxID=1398 RepID=UPI002810FEB6|nr:DUF1648 domain-containing protein [Heyndrickxia coagulans]WMM89385.1 DUF1648 domain-containing protein [Heyndrickxia coagulans]